MPVAKTYLYEAKVLRWIDGDTVVVEADLGFYVRLELHVRLQGYNAPELPTPAGIEALNLARTQVPEGSSVWIKTYKTRQSFTRWIGDVFYPDMSNVLTRLVPDAHPALVPNAPTL